MLSFQYKIWKHLLKVRYNRRAREQKNELRLGQEFEMPRPPKLLNRKNNIEEYYQNRNSIYICHPEKKKTSKVILYLHGGAYFTRIMLPHWIFIRKLSNRFGMDIYVPDYPTAPAYNYLQTNDFVLTAYKKLLEDHKADDIYFFGDSAGGGLSLTLAQQIRGKGLPLPSGLFLLSPWLDVSMTNPEIREIEKDDFMLSLDNLLIAGELYAEEADLKDPLISPIYGDIQGLPQINLFIGTNDLLLPDCRRFRQIAHDENISINYFEYDKMFHCWMLFPIPEAQKVLEKIGELIGDNPGEAEESSN
jgi:acetyl esterase/lipase